MHFLIYSVENQFFSEFIRHQYVVIPFPWAWRSKKEVGKKTSCKFSAMHLYVNSKRSHRQSSMGSFISAIFVSQHESVRDSLEVEKWRHLAGGCKHCLGSPLLSSLPDKWSQHLRRTWCRACPSLVGVYTPRRVTQRARSLELCNRSLVGWRKQAEPRASSSRNSSFLKRASCVTIKPQHAPAKLSLTVGLQSTVRFSISKVDFFSQMRYSWASQSRRQRSSVRATPGHWLPEFGRCGKATFANAHELCCGYGDSWAGIACASFMPHHGQCNCTLEYCQRWLYAQKCRQWQEKHTTISTHHSVGLIRKGYRRAE